ncbi:MAG: hypothetical protein WC229_01140 [Candidatus Paceibacterota bacterium]|jgi:hypothetical protein
MKRLYVWEWIMVLVSVVTYFLSLYHGFTPEESVVMATLVSLAAAAVSILCLDSVIVTMIAFAAIGAVGLIILDIPTLTVASLLVVFIVGAILLSVKYIIDSRDEIDYYGFFGSLASEFTIIFLVLRYGHLLWNYWQKF